MNAVLDSSTRSARQLVRLQTGMEVAPRIPIERAQEGAQTTLPLQASPR